MRSSTHRGSQALPTSRRISFRKSRGKPAVVVLLHYPLREKSNTDDSKNPCFTHEVGNATEECFRPFGLEVIKVDLRKECRRNEHCLGIKPGRESFTLGLRKAIEILIAAQVFGIKVQATIAWSKTASTPGGPTDIILGWDESLLGKRRLLAEFRPLPRDHKHSIQLAGMANHRPSQIRGDNSAAFLPLQEQFQVINTTDLLHGF
ncbi:hypothetical protein FDECE_16009 [Fusarium decemcellulare]|nr:hypothetical protein FDECE_16009 [Fusarium decemcellulare]